MFKCWLTSLGLVLLALPQAWAGGDLFVGNGGEVFRQRNQIVLRDLHGLPAPVFGNEIFPVVQQGFENSPLARLPLPDRARNLLMFKLTDIERMEPNLGLFILEGSRFYTWTFVNEKLKLVSGDPVVTQLPAGTEHLTAANRLLNTIRIQRQLWYQMDDETKVGLIIHELIYSLVTVACSEPVKNCAQSPAITREIVAKAFSASHGVGYRLTPSMRLQLNGLSLVNSKWDGLARVRLQLFGIDSVQRTSASALADASTLLGYNPEAREKLIQEFCGNVINRGVALISAEAPSSYVTDYNYPAANGAYQVGLCIVPKAARPDLNRTFIDVMSSTECMSSLRVFFDQFFEPPSNVSCDPIVY